MSDWWQRDDLNYQSGKLHINNQEVSELVRCFSTPLFIYSWPRIQENIIRLKKALAQLNNEWRLLYAMKANRFQPLLS